MCHDNDVGEAYDRLPGSRSSARACPCQPLRNLDARDPRLRQLTQDSIRVSPGRSPPPATLILSASIVLDLAVVSFASRPQRLPQVALTRLLFTQIGVGANVDTCVHDPRVIPMQSPVPPATARPMLALRYSWPSNAAIHARGISTPRRPGSSKATQRQCLAVKTRQCRTTAFSS